LYSSIINSWFHVIPSNTLIFCIVIYCFRSQVQSFLTHANILFTSIFYIVLEQCIRVWPR
jgi:hypothetical protein